MIVLPESVSFVPPQPTRNGLDAGKSTVGFPLDAAVGGTVIARSCEDGDAHG